MSLNKVSMCICFAVKTFALYVQQSPSLPMAIVVVSRKPRVRRVVQKSLSDKEGIKTPFAL